MLYYVYLIVSDRKNRLTSYVGYTKNIKNRLKQHNSSKGAKFTKGNKWKLIYKRSYTDKKIAMSEEYKLKKNKKLRNILKFKYLNK
tara:strand:- start:182 stop:439 length:258 start_codon:yes stop_codon:yes gene_type:complete